MASLATGAMGRVKEIWGRLNPTQRWLAGGLGLALFAAVGAATYLNRTEWVVLVSQADPKDAAEVVARLQELKVPYQPTGDRTMTISVPKTEQYTAKLALAQAGLPKGTGVGLEIFQEPKFGATEFDRKVNYLRAQQGELERALLRMAELEYANVKLAIPDRSVFLRDQQPVTASVLVQPRTGRKLTPEQVIGIVNFVSNAVQGLTPENVKVVDQTGRLLSNGITANGTFELSGGDNDQLQKQVMMQKDVEQRVQSLLEPIFGVGNVIARVNLELNTEASRIESTTIGGSTPRSTETAREAAQGRSTAGTGATDPNNPPIYQGDNGSTGNSDEWKTKTVTNYAVSERKEVTLIAPGTVKRLSVGIAVNRTDLSPEQIKMIQDTVAGATGADAAAINVAAMLFNREVATELTGSVAARVQPTTLAIGLGSAAVVLIAGFFLARRRQEQDGDVVVPLDLTPQLAGAPVGTSLDVALGLDSQPIELGSLGGTGPVFPDQNAVFQQEDDMAQSTAAASKQRLELIMATRPKRQIVLDGQPVDEELMQLVDDLIDSSPEACADMLRQWMKGGA